MTRSWATSLVVAAGAFVYPTSTHAPESVQPLAAKPFDSAANLRKLGSELTKECIDVSAQMAKDDIHPLQDAKQRNQLEESLATIQQAFQKGSFAFAHQEINKILKQLPPGPPVNEDDDKPLTLLNILQETLGTLELMSAQYVMPKAIAHRR